MLVLNADTVLAPGSVTALRHALAAGPSLGGVQPRILQLEGAAGVTSDPSGARLYSAGQALTPGGRAIERGAGEAQSFVYLTPQEIFGVCGAACLLRRELFDDLGGYDERYFAFYEDVDLNVRARIAGWRFAYVPEAVVWHVGNASWQAGFRRPEAENARLVARNRLATQVKFMPLCVCPADRRRRGRLAAAGRERAPFPGHAAWQAQRPALAPRPDRRAPSPAQLWRPIACTSLARR